MVRDTQSALSKEVIILTRLLVSTAVGKILASTMGVSFPDSFYDRMAKEPEPVPLGGASDAKVSMSRASEPTTVDVSADNIHSFLFHNLEAYPHAMMVTAYMPPDANEQHARDEAVEAEVTRQEVDAEMSVDWHPGSDGDGVDDGGSPTSMTGGGGLRQSHESSMRSSSGSTVHLRGARGQAASNRKQRSGRMSQSFDSMSRLGPDPADVRASQQLPSGEMSAVLSSLQSLHATAHFPSHASEAPTMAVPHGTATSDQAVDLMALLRDMRQEMREMDEQRQSDSDSMKMQMSLVLEGNGELAEGGRKQLRLGQEVSEMVRDMREMQVEGASPFGSATLALSPPARFDPAILVPCVLTTDARSVAH